MDLKGPEKELRGLGQELIQKNVFCAGSRVQAAGCRKYGRFLLDVSELSFRAVL